MLNIGVNIKGITGLLDDESNLKKQYAELFKSHKIYYDIEDNKFYDHKAKISKKLLYLIPEKYFRGGSLDKDKKIPREGRSYLLRDLFLHFQGHQLTDKEIYDDVGKYPVLSGADNEPKGFMNRPLFRDESILPCLIYQTKGNNEFKSKVVRNLFNANNTAVLYVKKSKKDMVNIDYVQLVIAHNMQLAISSQEGVS